MQAEADRLKESSFVSSDEFFSDVLPAVKEVRRVLCGRIPVPFEHEYVGKDPEIYGLRFQGNRHIAVSRELLECTLATIGLRLAAERPEELVEQLRSGERVLITTTGSRPLPLE